MIRALLIIAAQIIAFWPVWRWYAARVGGSTDEAWGLLPAFACVAYFIWRGKTAESDTVKLELLFPVLLVLTYAASYQFLPPLLRAVVAVTAVGCTASLLRFGRRFHPGILGLLYLSLPLIPSLQFYGGYPLRAFVAMAAAPLLRLGGFAVVQEGTCLNWAGRLIWVDAPCSGIRMLWVGMFVACAARLSIRTSASENSAGALPRPSSLSSRGTSCAPRLFFTSRPESSGRRRRGRTITSASSRSRRSRLPSC
jgi:hypothetical protein